MNLGVLVANKIDLEEFDRRVITSEEGMEFARQNGLEYFEVSSVIFCFYYSLWSFYRAITIKRRER